MKRYIIICLATLATFAVQAQEGYTPAINNSAAPAYRAARTTSIMRPVAFQGYASVGTSFMTFLAGPTVDVNLGVRIYEHLHVGVEAGFHALFLTFGGLGDDGYLYYIPIGINLKGYLTRGYRVAPYLSATFGTWIEKQPGFHCRAGVGVDIRRFSLGVGYNGIVIDGTALNMGYVSLGVRFGKNNYR